MATNNNLKRMVFGGHARKVALPATLVVGEDELRVGTISQPEVNFQLPGTQCLSPAASPRKLEISQPQPAYGSVSNISNPIAAAEFLLKT